MHGICSAKPRRIDNALGISVVQPQQVSWRSPAQRVPCCSRGTLQSTSLAACVHSQTVLLIDMQCILTGRAALEGLLVVALCAREEVQGSNDDVQRSAAGCSIPRMNAAAGLDLSGWKRCAPGPCWYLLLTGRAAGVTHGRGADRRSVVADVLAGAAALAAAPHCKQQQQRQQQEVWHREQATADRHSFELCCL